MKLGFLSVGSFARRHSLEELVDESLIYRKIIKSDKIEKWKKQERVEEKLQVGYHEDTLVLVRMSLQGFASDGTFTLKALRSSGGSCRA